MKSKRTLLIIILLFVLLLGSAYLLYERLGQETEIGQLAVHETPVPAEQGEQSGEAPVQNEADSVSDDKDRDKVENEEKPLAPDFTVYDAEGNAVQLYDYIGKPIVLNFWASWCSPCQREMPDFDEKYLELGDKVQFLMINMTDGSRETVDTAYEFIAEKGYSFPVFYDTDSTAAIAYGAYSIPTTYFIDADGYALARASGTIDADTLQTGIDMITGE